MTAGFSLLALTPMFVFLWLVQSAHLELIDALMAVGAMETVSAVTASGGSELLSTDASWDRALLCWVNRVSPLSSQSQVPKTPVICFSWTQRLTWKWTLTSFTHTFAVSENVFFTYIIFLVQLNQKLKEQSEGTQTDGCQLNNEPQPVQPSVRNKHKNPHRLHVQNIVPFLWETYFSSLGQLCCPKYCICPSLFFLFPSPPLLLFLFLMLCHLFLTVSHSLVLETCSCKSPFRLPSSFPPFSSLEPISSCPLSPPADCTSYIWFDPSTAWVWHLSHLIWASNALVMTCVCMCVSWSLSCWVLKWK